MVMFILVILKKGKFVIKFLLNIKMEKVMMVIIKIIKNGDMDALISKMEILMWEILKMIYLMEKEF